MAHLLEHMLFKGSTNFPDIKGELTRRGARWNGTTSNDRTNYFETLSATAGKPRLGARHGSRPHGELARLARGPRQRDDRGAQRVRDGREQSRLGALPAHAAARLCRGTTTATRSSASAPTSRRCRSTSCRRSTALWYQPDNAVLLIAGRFEEPRALELVAKHFGADPEARARAAQLLHRGADAGRRARGDARARRRQPASSPRSIASSPAAIPTIRRSTCWCRSSATRRRAACTARWCRRASPARTWGAERQLHDPGYMYFGAQLAQGRRPRQGARGAARDASKASRRRRSPPTRSSARARAS